MTDAVQAIEAAGSMSASELGELFGAFNEVTNRLQETHERLTGEVVRLKGELRRANDELDRSRRLAALGEMAAGIAHEVRNPLGSIGLYAEMLIADLNDESGEQVIAEKIKRAVAGLDAVVGDVLTFSRTMQIRTSQIEVLEAVERAKSSCCDVLAGCDCTQHSSHITATVEADHGLLQQALVNIVRNAAEAASSNSQQREARVEISWEPVALERDAEEIAGYCLRIADSGCGLTTDVKERMFNPFFTTRNIGTGLGLAIVHRIIDAHGGQIRVRNAEKSEHFPGGAVIELLLPEKTQYTINNEIDRPFAEADEARSDR
jgi:signal transduction histidine kinase